MPEKRLAVGGRRSGLHGEIMKLVSKTIIYTEEDMKGFQFFDIPMEKREERLQIILKKKYKNIKICYVLLLPSILLSLIISNEMFLYWMALYNIAMIFLLLVFLYAAKAEKKDYRKGNLKMHRIEIIKKMPRELVSNAPSNAGTHKYFPVLGKDIMNGYESICYISQKDYENNNIGQVVECWKLQISKERDIALISNIV